MASEVPSLPLPRPKSPPKCPDLYGKRREIAKVQMLERGIGFIEEELKSVGGLQPASKCCKEVTEFITTKSDPFMSKNHKKHKSCHFWKWLCGASCFKFSWICCCCRSECSIHVKMPHCGDCQCNPCKCLSCHSCFHCPKPKCTCCCLPSCCRKASCSKSCCTFQYPSCSDPCCSQCKCSCFRCPKVQCSCTKTCCNPCYFCC